ncbi:MAG: T9SS type A sorting domain-containing protein [Lewinellaceae bacterium]|nr:T9SS type A sorting domain-containing protein [Lewinellaceae bacterium]
MKKLLTLIAFLVLFWPSLSIAQVNPVELGKASNAFTILNPNQNQVHANNDLNMVAFIHRQDIQTLGGESGYLRYDLSTDGGNSFVTEVGILNNAYQAPARYPQLTGFNPGNSSNPLDTKLIWSGATIGSTYWLGDVSGLADVTATSPPASTENYSQQVYIPAGLSQGLPGEFWMVARGYLGSNLTTGEIEILKGVYNETTEDIDWGIYQTITPEHNLSFDGSVHMTSYNLAFSPDGQTGWAAFLGDLYEMGDDSIFSPVLIPTFDGGLTWEDPIEVDLRLMDYLGDSTTLKKELQAFFFTDSTMTTPASTGRPTCGFDYDITVDANGNPHFFAIVGSASLVSNPNPAYSIYSALPLLALDIYSENGGDCWKAVKVSDVYNFRGTFGIFPNSVTQDNYPQISRSPDGHHIFYSWVDTELTLDSTLNSLPNLHVAGRNLLDEMMTPVQKITTGDPVWGGKAYFPTMAPEVLIDQDGNFKLPIVSTDFIQDDPYASCSFWYWGNEATFSASDFTIPSDIAEECAALCADAELDASFSYVTIGAYVFFTESSIFEVVPPSEWLWNFGDGNTSAEQHPEHSYAESGTYEVCLTASNVCTSSEVCMSVEVTVSGLSELQLPTLKAYPNPVADMLTIEFEEQPSDPMQFNMFTMTGQLVRTSLLQEKVSIVDLSEIEAGMYFARLKNRNAETSFKIMVY